MDGDDARDAPSVTGLVQGYARLALLCALTGGAFSHEQTAVQWQADREAENHEQAALVAALRPNAAAVVEERKVA
jgi:hypothetical protein